MRLTVLGNMYLICNDSPSKAQGCTWRFWVLYGTTKRPRFHCVYLLGTPDRDTTDVYYIWKLYEALSKRRWELFWEIGKMHELCDTLAPNIS